MNAGGKKSVQLAEHIFQYPKACVAHFAMKDLPFETRRN